MFAARSLLAVEVFAPNEVAKRIFEEGVRWPISHSLWIFMAGFILFAALLVFFICATIYDQAIPNLPKPQLHRVSRSTDLQSLVSKGEKKKETSKINGNAVSYGSSRNRFKSDVTIEADVYADFDNDEYITFTAPPTD
ncbi:hypothetical protein PPYR_05553 [Photinus pyralis]|uniref:Uncharacterized protein n=2 Tax=Photinus pyralis TaxID=7054 RepID=A0A5N4AV50_PHOPY|nr:hypothetical protein PPYR_05553 [Photinus pyralis]